jgi:queuine tRNA-ribosyltransferase
MKPYFYFEEIYKSKRSRARIGRIHTPHGVIETPNFVPVATHAALKGIDSITAHPLDIQLMFCNTYHLLLHPGPQTIASAGGLHQFMKHSGPLITDSGGFQVFSLAYGTVHNELKSKGKKQQDGTVIKINEEGVLFRSYRDGSLILLTPELSVQVQKSLGADIIIPLDELPPYHVDPQDLKKSLNRTHRWEQRSLEEHLKDVKQQAMYAVIHGGIDDKLRKESINFLKSLPFDGFAIGGSLGTCKSDMVSMLKQLTPLIPEDKPIHLLGIADMPSLEATIPLGIDTFDSSHPTRCARHALLFTKQGNLTISKTAYKNSFIPIDESCSCFTCVNYTRSYIHHLFKTKELSALSLATIHNIHFMMNLMKSYRRAILNDHL